MKYAKLIDDEIVYAPRKLRGPKYTIYNPTPEQLLEFGYKPVRYTEPPETEPGYIAVEGWTETADEIVQTWTIIQE